METPKEDLSDILEADVQTKSGEWLSAAVARVQGWVGVFWEDNALWAKGCPPNWLYGGGIPIGVSCPHRSPMEALKLLNKGVEEFGGVCILADMEEWAEGGLYQVNFYDSPRCWFAPFGIAVCRAYLLAWQAREHNRSLRG